MKIDLTGQKIEGFVLLEFLDEGGSADIYRSIEPLSQSPIVIKVLRNTDQNSGDQKRFEREAALSSLLVHPLVARVHSSGRHNNHSWMAMEWVHGQNLKRWLAEHGPISLEALIPLLEPVVDVLGRFHGSGIIHRDLKPSNLMVTEVGGREIWRLIDLGLAKVPPQLASALTLREPTAAGDAASADGTTGNHSVTNTNVLTGSKVGMGSMPFMPPEQWRSGAAAVIESDVYAIGIVVYNALTGRLPFDGKTPKEFQDLHELHPVPSVGGELARDLDPILRRALAKDPTQRYHSALEFLSELRKAQKAREARRARRTRAWLVGISAAFVVALAAVITLGVWHYQSKQEVRAAEQVAEAVRTQAEADRGRMALLAGQPSAADHLAEAYKRGDHSTGLEFMLARALQSLLTVAQLPSSVGAQWSASYSPDGTKIVTTDERNAQVWDATSYKRLLLLPHDAEVYRAFFSSDSKRLVTLSRTAVRVWNAIDGSLIHELKPNSGSKLANYFVAAVSSDDMLVAAADSADQLTRVWDTNSGRVLAELPGIWAGWYALAFSSDNHWLAVSGGSDVRLFDTTTWKDTKISVAGVHCLTFAPDKPLLLTGTTTGDVATWHASTGALAQHLNIHGAAITALAWAPNGELIAAGNRKGTVQIWRADSGDWLDELNIRASKILSLEFDRSSKLVLAATFDGAAVVGDVLGNAVAVFDGPKGRLSSAHFDARAQHVLGASFDGKARIWDVSSAYRRSSSPAIDEDCRTVVSNPTNRIIAMACKDHPTQVWDVSTDRLLATLPSVSDVNGTLVNPAVSQSQDRVAIAHGTVVDLYDLPSGRLLGTISHAAQVSAVAFVGTTRDVLTGALDGSVRLTRESRATVEFPSSTAGIDSIDSLPDGRVVTTDVNRRLRVYDRGASLLVDLELSTRGTLRIAGTNVVIVPHTDVRAAAPLLVDLDSHRIVGHLDGHKGRVFDVQWIAGAQLLTAGNDGKVCRWTAWGQLLQCYVGVPVGFIHANVTPEGVVVAGDLDGRLWFWDLDGDQLWALQAQAGVPIVAIHVDGDDVVTFGLRGEVFHAKLPRLKAIASRCNEPSQCAIFTE